MTKNPRLFSRDPITLFIHSLPTDGTIDPESSYASFLKTTLPKAELRRLDQLSIFSGDRISPSRTPKATFNLVDLRQVNATYGICNPRTVKGASVVGVRRKFKAGDLLFSRIRPYLRRVAATPPTTTVGICSPEFSVLEPTTQKGLYVLALLRTRVISEQTKKTGSTRPRVQETELKGLRIPVVAQSHAPKIHRLLSQSHSLLWASEGYINKVARDIENQITAAVGNVGLPESFAIATSVPSGRIDPEFHILQKWVKKLRRGACNWKPLTDFVEMAEDFVDPRTFTTFRYIEIGDINTDTGQIDSFSVETGASPPGRAQQPLREGDIIVSRTRPGRGAVALVPSYHDQDIATNAVAVLRAKDSRMQGYLYCALRTRYMRLQMHLTGTGTAYPEISTDDLKQVLFPILRDYDPTKSTKPIRTACDGAETARTAIRGLEQVLDMRMANEATDEDVARYCVESMPLLEEALAEVSALHPA